jgi:hypothetical protein
MNAALPRHVEPTSKDATRAFMDQARRGGMVQHVEDVLLLGRIFT